MAAPNLDQIFIEDESRITGDIAEVMRNKGRVSAMIPKGVLPTGIGHNFSAVSVDRSVATGGSGWEEVAIADGTGNNCVPDPSIVAPALTQRTYNGYQKAIMSSYICFRDAMTGYDFAQQVAKQRANFVGNIVDDWEDRDTSQYIYGCGRKIVINPSLTETGYGASLPAAEATGILTQSYLDELYQELVQDGAGEGGIYGNADGQPLIPIMMDMSTHASILQGDSSLRNDIRVAETGKGATATLLKGWGADKSLRGFMHVINTRLPRYDFVDGAYVQRNYYSSSATTIGNKADVSSAYKNAEYGVALVWSDSVVKRLVPPSLATVGADTTAPTLAFDGTVKWLNIPDMDINPWSDTGRWGARLYAAYRPDTPQYGCAILYKRCPGVTITDCY